MLEVSNPNVIETIAKWRGAERDTVLIVLVSPCSRVIPECITRMAPGFEVLQ